MDLNKLKELHKTLSEQSLNHEDYGTYADIDKSITDLMSDIETYLETKGEAL